MKRLTFKQVKFVKSCSEFSKCPRVLNDAGSPLEEIAVAGRSNVGKSSLLNHLFRVKNMVKTSQKPGKTRLLNFFNVDSEVVFCDLPGYGFAQVSSNIRANWKKMIESYIEKRESLKLVLLLLDSRRVPSEQDLQFFEWVQFLKIPIVIVFTKVDKLSKNELAKQIKKNLDILNVEGLPFTKYSTTKNIGRKELIYEINERLSA